MIGRLVRNPGLKLLSLGIALCLWVLVASEQDAVRVYTVPLDYRLGAERLIAGDPPATVQVRVRGPETVLRGLAAQDLAVPVDLVSAPDGAQTVHILTPGSVSGVPSAAVVESVSPERLRLGIQRLTSRAVPVAARLEGTPAPGHHVMDYTTDPARVTIEGPESEVARVPAVYTDPIPLHAARADLTLHTGAWVENPRVRVVDPGPIVVTVRIAKDDEPR